MGGVTGGSWRRHAVGVGVCPLPGELRTDRRMAGRGSSRPHPWGRGLAVPPSSLPTTFHATRDPVTGVGGHRPWGLRRALGSPPPPTTPGKGPAGPSADSRAAGDSRRALWVTVTRARGWQSPVGQLRARRRGAFRCFGGSGVGQELVESLPVGSGNLRSLRVGVPGGPRCRRGVFWFASRQDFFPLLWRFSFLLLLLSHSSVLRSANRCCKTLIFALKVAQESAASVTRSRLRRLPGTVGPPSPGPVPTEGFGSLRPGQRQDARYLGLGVGVTVQPRRGASPRPRIPPERQDVASEERVTPVVSPSPRRAAAPSPRWHRHLRARPRAPALCSRASLDPRQPLGSGCAGADGSTGTGGDPAARLAAINGCSQSSRPNPPWGDAKRDLTCVPENRIVSLHRAVAEHDDVSALNCGFRSLRLLLGVSPGNPVAQPRRFMIFWGQGGSAATPPRRGAAPLTLSLLPF